MLIRKIKSLAIISVIGTCTTACGSDISDETFLGMTVCAQVWNLDMNLQNFGSTKDYTADIDKLVTYSNEAVRANLERYGQLGLLINEFKDAVESGDERQLLNLVAVEGECENLGFGMDG